MPTQLSSLNKPSGLEQPRGNRIIWRYLSLEKFYRLLLEKKLHFVLADRFTDQNEFQVITRPPSKDKAMSITPEHLAQCVRAYKLKKKTFVSCWSIGSQESYAFWKLYLSGSRSGVAIRTRASNLEKSLIINSDRKVFAGCVKYTDFLPSTGLEDHDFVCSKIKAYSYESEYRLWTYSDQPEANLSDLSSVAQLSELAVDVNLATLLDTVYLSPFAGAWFRRSFERTVACLAPGLSVKTHTSGIRDL